MLQLLALDTGVWAITFNAPCRRPAFQCPGADMSRTGKIARLPKEIREQLNRRLEDGETGVEVSTWLNGLPECQKLVAEDVVRWE